MTVREEGRAELRPDFDGNPMAGCEGKEPSSESQPEAAKEEEKSKGQMFSVTIPTRPKISRK